MTSEKTVLIVEDDGVIAMDIHDELASRGWRATAVAGTLNAAQAALDKQVPDLAVLDVNLRGRQTYDLAKDLRARGVAVVFLSGNSAKDLPDALRGCAFVQKPVNYDLLQTTLCQAVSGGKGASVKAG